MQDFVTSDKKCKQTSKSELALLFCHENSMLEKMNSMAISLLLPEKTLLAIMAALLNIFLILNAALVIVNLHKEILAKN